jgi:hypothetical protein
MGGNRSSLPRQMLYIGIVFLLTGFWHGAGWTFIAWGGLHGLLVIINHLWSRTVFAQKLRTSQYQPFRQAYAFASWALTMTSVTALWVIFRADSWYVVEKFANAMLAFKFLGTHPFPDMNIYYTLPPVLMLLFAACWRMPNSYKISLALRRATNRHLRDSTGYQKKYIPLLTWTGLIGTMLYMAISSVNYVKSDFLYFNF